VAYCGADEILRSKLYYVLGPLPEIRAASCSGPHLVSPHHARSTNAAAKSKRAKLAVELAGLRSTTQRTVVIDIREEISSPTTTTTTVSRHMARISRRGRQRRGCGRMCNA
jgi:hypothetical protein